MQGAMTLLSICSVILCHGATGSYTHSEKTLITFNAALQDSLPMKEERREALLKGLKASGADVVCLQEVFDRSDIKRLWMGLLDNYLHSFSFVHHSTSRLKKRNEPPCKSPEFSEFLTCVSTNCSQFDTSVEDGKLAFYGCLQDHCARQVFSLPQECLTCIFIRIDIKEALDVCHLNSTTMINVPGLLLFSKRKILNASAVYYHPNITEIAKRGYLQADIETIGTVVCTHLSTPFLGDLYPEALLQYGNYKDQNLAEVNKLLAAVKDITPLVLAGDFNTGPEIPESDVCAELPESYKALSSTKSRLFHTTVNKCTFCNGNTWLQQDCDSTIDHVFLRGYTHKCITPLMCCMCKDKCHLRWPYYITLTGILQEEIQGTVAHFG